MPKLKRGIELQLMHFLCSVCVGCSLPLRFNLAWIEEQKQQGIQRPGLTKFNVSRALIMNALVVYTAINHNAAAAAAVATKFINKEYNIVLFLHLRN